MHVVVVSDHESVGARVSGLGVGLIDARVSDHVIRADVEGVVPERHPWPRKAQERRLPVTVVDAVVPTAERAPVRGQAVDVEALHVGRRP